MMSYKSELDDFIKKGLAEGVSREELTRVLIERGWKASDISIGLSKSHIDHRKLFMVVIGIFLLLAATGLYFTYSYVKPSASLSAETSQTISVIQISTTTPQHILSKLTISDVIPKQGKFIGADLVGMKLYLYQDGQLVSEYPILTKGRPGTPFETPSGFYQVLTKESNHFSSLAKVNMPYSMQFYGNYFIHGWPYYSDGTPVASTFSGGCIRLSTNDAAKVFAFAGVGTKMFVYDSGQATSTALISIATTPAPNVSAESYLVADIDTGEVYADKDPNMQLPIASVTKLMSALVANETINFEQRIPTTSGDLQYPQSATSTRPESVLVGKLLYPLIMESNDAVARTLASYYGTQGFVSWMNLTATSLDMASTTYIDPSGESANNVSTVDDLYRLAVYLVTKKSFIFKISRLPSYTLHTDSGNVYPLENFNLFSDSPDFIGGKVGQTSTTGDTMLSVFQIPTPTTGAHRVAIIILHSDNYKKDTEDLLSWMGLVSAHSSVFEQTACVSCAELQGHRIIQL